MCNICKAGATVVQVKIGWVKVWTEISADKLPKGILSLKLGMMEDRFVFAIPKLNYFVP